MKRIALILAACTLLATAAHAQTPVLTLTLETSTTADQRAILPKLTWSTTPTATSCTASGGTGWAGNKSPAGSLTLAAVTTSQAYTLVCNWPGVTLATVTWQPPTTNTDNTPLTDLAGFIVKYGTSPTALTQSSNVAGATVTTWTSPTLTPGTWYFNVLAVNALGLVSDPSNTVNKTTTASTSDTRSLTLGIKYPSPPVVN